MKYIILVFCSFISFYTFAEWIEVKKWDLQTYSDSTWLNLTKDAANWKANGKTRFDSKVEMGGTLKANGVIIAETEGIKFPYMEQDNFNIRRGFGLQLGSNRQEVKILNRTQGEKIEIVLSSTNSTSTRGISNIANMVGELGNTVGNRTYTYTVIDNGDVSFTYSAAGGIILKSITVYKDDAKPGAPALYRVSGAKEQSIYVKQPISDIVYRWDNTATSAKVEWTNKKTPAGITVTADEKSKKITISGTPTAAGIYEYSIVAADSTQTSNPQTGTITVKALPAGKKIIAYITNSNIPTDAADIAIIEKLRGMYEVDIIPANEAQAASAFDIYDAIILAALPKSSDVQVCLKGINKPLVSLKPFILNLWGWGSLVNLEAPASEGKIKDVPIGVTVSNTAHPIFAGLKTSAEIKLTTGSQHNRFRILTPVFSWTEGNEANIITLATIPSGKYNYTVTSPGSGTDLSGKPVIFEIKPNSVMNDGSKITQKTIHIGVSEQAAGYLTPEFLTIVKNAVDYVIKK